MRSRDLPLWPLYALFAGFPLWWVLGLGAFSPLLCSLPMAAALVIRGRIRAPRGFGLWLLFLVMMLIAATQLDTAGRLAGFAFRSATYLGATVVFLYVYNCSRDRLPIRRVAGLAVILWVWVVLGGYLGYLVPYGELSTPLERVLPESLLSNEYVRQLVHPTFAEIQAPWGSPQVFERPSAPFPYTNAWGSHYALLMPFVFMILFSEGSRRLKIGIGLLAVASLVPAFATLNRGMILALSAGLVYAALRFAARGRKGLLAGLAGALIVAAVAASTTGVLDTIGTRTDYSTTNVGRQTVYLEAFRGALESPVLGHGAPRPSETLGISVGTQGHFWNLMFSYGFPALILFCLALWGLAWRTRRPRSDALLWPHVALVMASFMIFYYGFDGGLQLVILLTGAAAALREPLA
ncbi:O-antigen ligase family protein [Rhizohabitans arisaemae]|uniref:O-antigen ligase family protein n=1 Tax=Rhizohabitans arisaemae TaxID=2720610 RepID=UPI0024B1A184|nr:O-antigen ligase family protein [Rhizohabitans arisaemae]